MERATSSVAPIINLHRIGALDLLPQLFDQIWMPSVVLEDLLDARFMGYNVPSPFDLPWVDYQDPQLTIPSVWIALDLSSGEVAAIALAFENRDCTVLIDEPIGRQAAAGVGIKYWGTLQILLEAKARGFIPSIIPYIKRLQHTGMFMTNEIIQRILALAGEKDGGEEDSFELFMP
jgi:predicted nucleic acid-binding protein